MLHLPLRTADVAATGRTSPMYQEVIEHPAFDAFWRAISTREQLGQINVPVFCVGGWYDNFVESDLEAYAALRAGIGVNRILIGPWPHNMSIPFQDVDFGPDSSLPVRALQLEWFDQWLMGKDTPLLSRPPVQIFVMGANRWREEREWPPRGRRAEDLLPGEPRPGQHAGGRWRAELARPRAGAADQFRVRSRSRCRRAAARSAAIRECFPWGPMDQRPVEPRKDVLVYTTRRCGRTWK